MKTTLIFTLALFYFGTSLFSKTIDDEIILKDGSKAIIEPNSFKVDFENKTVSYKILNSSQKKISFKDFISVEFGANKFQTFKLAGETVFEGYFVIAETDTKKLVVHTLPQEEEGITRYEFHVIENDNRIVDSHVFDNKKNQKSSNLRADIYGKIRFHFPNHIQLLKRLEMYDKNSFAIDNTKILGFFNNPVYFRNE